ncbi:hypothetical protein F5883DRAFT_627792 [Diaporthe sp. PMI_573]|nr:hypothetical protein F5883DRAFT_627792 [Diaporthaceae sp. PMI_573]
MKPAVPSGSKDGDVTDLDADADLPTLRSLVRASPVLHAQYRHDRNNILRACLARELDGLAVDACATLMSRVRDLGSPRTDEKITVFLATYRGWLSGSTPRPDVSSLDPGNVRWLVAYHLSVARPLASQYSKWALANLTKAASSSPGEEGDAESPAVHRGHDTRLSRSEEIRIYRALYRYETYHHLFGRNQGKRRGAFRHHEINELFFCLFDAWEAEAIGCVELFVRQRCLTHAHNLDAPMRRALGTVAQNDRRLMSADAPDARDEAEQRRDSMAFVGDGVPPDGPPLAWVLLWGGRYANICGEYVPEPLRRWGYVMWDKHRWTAMGAEQLVARQWETAPELVEEIENDCGWSPIEG